MGHTKANPSLFTCLDNAMPGEPTFELLARDPHFPKMVRAWADEREAAILAEDRPHTDYGKVHEARDCAADGERWRAANLYAWRNRPWSEGMSWLDVALDDEPFFPLLARDPSFPQLVRAWADEREAAIEAGDRPRRDMGKVIGARVKAGLGELWRAENLYAWRNQTPPVAAVERESFGITP
jgi:hypothetical protein